MIQFGACMELVANLKHALQHQFQHPQSLFFHFFPTNKEASARNKQDSFEACVGISKKLAIGSYGSDSETSF